jgi:hypothetical protein
LVAAGHTDSHLEDELVGGCESWMGGLKDAHIVNVYEGIEFTLIAPKRHLFVQVIEQSGEDWGGVNYLVFNF